MLQGIPEHLVQHRMPPISLWFWFCVSHAHWDWEPLEIEAREGLLSSVTSLGQIKKEN